MKYVMLICDDETDSPNKETLEADPRYLAYVKARTERSRETVGARLRPVAEAKSVRVRNGETLVSDGPFAETKDFVGGVVFIDCASLDDAIAIAAEHPWAYKGVVEIRPIWE
jgi:hypothetical protein